MRKFKSTTVFVPGGMPQHTYVERTEGAIRKRLEKAKENLCKLVTLTGQTKSGKTVLTQKVFSQLEEGNIWINGGSIENENDLWEQINDYLDGWTSKEESSEKTHGGAVKGDIEGEANAVIVKGRGKVGGELNQSRSTGTKKAVYASPKTAAIRALQQVDTSLVIDDFHYLDRNLQGAFVRAIKPLVFHGMPVILIAIPHRRYDAIKVEKEITGRVENILIHSWGEDELIQIPETGFHLLNVSVDDAVCRKLATEALGSPHLMQEFCRMLCDVEGINETLIKNKQIESLDEDIFSKVAESTGRTVFDKLATGPRQRSDRMPRKLKDGSRVDIYKVVLFALAQIRPSMQTIQYEELRAAIKDIVKESIPQAHEVSRVLDKMSEIAASDEASTPVIDWEKDEQKLHITDPFFAFYLKWGNCRQLK